MPIRAGFWLCAFWLVSISTLASGNFYTVKVDPTITTSGKRLSDKDIQASLIAVRREAIGKYLATHREALLSAFDHCSMSSASLQQIAAKMQSLGEPEFNKSTRQYRVKYKVFLNLKQLEQTLQGCTSSTATNNRVAVFILARQKVGSSGSAQYAALNNRLNEAISRLFVKKQFQVDSGIEIEYLSDGRFREEWLKRQYVENREISWIRALDAADISDVDLLVIGYVEAGVPSHNSELGLNELTLSGRAQAIEIVSNSVVASTDQFQFVAMGVNDEQMLEEATAELSDILSTQLIDQLISRSNYR